MSPAKYGDLELIVEKVRRKKGKYTVEVVGPTARTREPVIVEYRETEAMRTTLNWIKNGLAPSAEQMKAVGDMLFRTFFQGDARDVFVSSSNPNAWEADVDGLRLRLTVGAPELSHLPWELLRHKVFLAGQHAYPIVRFIPSEQPADLRPVRPPLRVLYVQANPGDTNKLTASDKEALLNAFGELGEVTPLWNATPRKLLGALETTEGFHIVHYEGHAEFDEESDKGYLLLHDDKNEKKSCRFHGEPLNILLNKPCLRLVVLAACKTAMDSKQRRFSGVAHQLMVASNLPAVVAMQFVIESEYAAAFMGGFYETLSRGAPVDAAVVAGRKAIVVALGDDPLVNSAWATPVLFTRSKDGYLFDLEPRAEVSLTGAKGGIDAPDPEQDREFERAEIKCSGWATCLEPGAHLWLVTETECGKYPKEGEVIVDEQGKWEHVIFEQGTAERFDLALYAVTPEVHDQIRAWLAKGDYPALDIPADGAKRLGLAEGLRRLLKVSLTGVKGGIETPKESDELKTAKIKCSGWTTGLKPGMHLWLVVETKHGKYPKEGEVTPDEDGKWEHVIFEQGTAEQIDLALYVVDSRGHLQIEDWLEKGEYEALDIRARGAKAKRLELVEGLRVNRRVKKRVKKKKR
jgi:hypothetical protein